MLCLGKMVRVQKLAVDRVVCSSVILRICVSVYIMENEEEEIMVDMNTKSPASFKASNLKRLETIEFIKRHRTVNAENTESAHDLPQIQQQLGDIASKVIHLDGDGDLSYVPCKVSPHSSSLSSHPLSSPVLFLCLPHNQT